MNQKLPAIIGITGSIVGVALTLSTIFWSNLLILIAGIFVLLTSMLAYIFLSIWGKKPVLKAKKPITAVLSALYLALAAYAAIIVVNGNKAASIDPNMDPNMNTNIEGDLGSSNSNYGNNAVLGGETIAETEGEETESSLSEGDETSEEVSGEDEEISSSEEESSAVEETTQSSGGSVNNSTNRTYSAPAIAVPMY